MRIGILAPVATADVAHLLTGSTGGAPKGMPGAPFIATLIDSYLALGHEVIAITSDKSLHNSKGPQVLAGSKFRLWLCPSRPNGTLPQVQSPIGRIWDFFRIERQNLMKVIEKEPTDILHAHWTYEFAWAAIASGRPCIVTIHDSPSDIFRLAPTPYTFGRYLMAKRVLKANIPFTAVSPFIAKVRTNRVALKPVYVIANPLPTSLKEHVEIHRVGSRSEKATIAMAPGYWNSFKNPLPGILAFAELNSKSSTPLELHLYGADFAPGGKAEKKIRMAGVPLQNIRLHGQLEHKALLKQIGKADLFLHTSLTESFGMAVAEAMAMGVPVVAGEASGAIPWLLGYGAAGQLVNVTRKDDIRNAISKGLVRSDEICKQIATAAETISQLTDQRSIALKYVDAYRETIGSW